MRTVVPPVRRGVPAYEWRCVTGGVAAADKSSSAGRFDYPALSPDA